MGAWHLALAPGARNGHAGVALLARTALTDVVLGVGDSEFTEQGRWVEASVSDPVDGSRIRLASVYVHTGEPEGPRAEEKDRFLTAMGSWMAGHSGEAALVCGDLNVAHTQHDIKNWRGNRGKAGFLESERAHLDRWYADAPTASGGSTWAAASAATAPDRTRGGRGVAAGSTPTAAGGSTPCWPRPRWQRARPGSRCTRQPATPSAGATTRRCRPRSPEPDRSVRALGAPRSDERTSPGSVRAAADQRGMASAPARAGSPTGRVLDAHPSGSTTSRPGNRRKSWSRV